MLKEMKATREQRVKRLEDSKHNFTSWLTHLATNPEITREYGMMMEKMRLSMEKEKERLSVFHKYTDESGPTVSYSRYGERLAMEILLPSYTKNYNLSPIKTKKMPISTE